MGLALTSLGKTSVKSSGYFNSEIEIHNSKITVDIFVVNDISINFALVIGTDVI